MNSQPLNVVGPTGVRYRTHVAANITLAELRKSLAKEGIIDDDARFQIKNNVILQGAEEYVRWADIPRSCNSEGSNSHSSTLVPLHRLYYPSTEAARHFYTTDSAERDAYIRDGYILEPTAGLILPSPSPDGDSIPLFRTRITDEHLYTTDVAEKERTLAQADTKDEGVVGYVYAEQRTGTLPLYRMYSPYWHKHCYTNSANEKDACAQLEWKVEGIACYVYA